MIVGKRTKRNTKKLIEDFAKRTNNKKARLITSDEYKPYSEAILETYGIEEEIERVKKRGRRKKPKKKIPEDLLYVIVKKYRRKGKVCNIKIKLKYGTEEKLQRVLETSDVSNQVNTSFVERYNGTDRQMNSRKRRLSNTFSKDLDYHKAESWFIVTYYNFCKYNNGLREKLPEEKITGKRKYKKRTPSMAAGIMEHKLSILELANLRV